MSRYIFAICQTCVKVRVGRSGYYFLWVYLNSNITRNIKCIKNSLSLYPFGDVRYRILSQGVLVELDFKDRT